MQGGKRKGAGRPAIAPELKKKSKHVLNIMGNTHDQVAYPNLVTDMRYQV